jgi:hypothetical protein
LLATNYTSFTWKRWQEQGREFLTGAEFYLQNNAQKAALFLLKILLSFPHPPEVLRQ